MNKPTKFDFWYAVNNTEILLKPSRHLETFGSTVLNYHLVTEPMDRVGQVRIRRGRLEAARPQIVTPEAYAKMTAEGFGEEARKYLEWLREHEAELKILRYGYDLKQESFREEVVTGRIETVTERVRSNVTAHEDPFSAVLTGVDSPWDVCLVKLFWQVIQDSAEANVRELSQRHLFEKTEGLPNFIREEVEKGFLAASRDKSLTKRLGQRLQELGVFDRYQDRFFALVRDQKS